MTGALALKLLIVGFVPALAGAVGGAVVEPSAVSVTTGVFFAGAAEMMFGIFLMSGNSQRDGSMGYFSLAGILMPMGTVKGNDVNRIRALSTGAVLASAGGIVLIAGVIGAFLAA